MIKLADANRGGVRRRGDPRKTLTPPTRQAPGGRRRRLRRDLRAGWASTKSRALLRDAQRRASRRDAPADRRRARRRLRPGRLPANVFVADATPPPRAPWASRPS
ncbi:MAG: hypothetical protein MZU84_05995 [Sphingobacterium sp.]|nr:hypothetical protein [Sphingobacterium sp.]